jgi:hypothetical protein
MVRQRGLYFPGQGPDVVGFVTDGDDYGNFHGGEYKMGTTPLATIKRLPRAF